jgi:hypothetical protein
MKAPHASAALAAIVTLALASTAGAQETVIVGGPAPKPAAGDDIVVVPAGSTITIVNGLPPLPPLPPAAPLPVPVVPPAAPPQAPLPTAWVHLQGSPNLVLEAVLPGQTDWRPVCRDACDKRVPLDGLYRVTRQGMQVSKSVHLAALDGDHVTLTVDPTAESTHTAGEALIILGGVGILGGGVILYADAVTAGLCSTPYSGCSSPGTGLLWAGLGAAVVGGVALVAGIKMVQPSSVEQSPVAGGAGAAGDPRDRPLAREDAYKRSPVWHDALQADLAPKVTSTPLFSASF